ncbi:MAG: hypothetical protein NT175_06345 [Bacteroidetes bacterium]|nr:hypothetical protein [Bacteroidota bacterium]
MKRRNLFTSCLVLLVVSVLLFCCKGRVSEDEARGTIGKVKKYRKSQMTENDIKLRSKILEDTAQLATTIKGLVIFDAYTKALTHDLDGKLPELDVCECDQNEALKLEILRNFNDYIKNNDSLLTGTITMLSEFYKDTVSEKSFDVEQSMKNILNYFNQLNKRDTVMDNLITNIDAWLKANPKKKGTEIDNLKNVRDGIVLRDMQMAILLGTPGEIQAAADRVILNTENLQAYYGIDFLNSILSAEQLNEFLATGSLNDVLNASNKIDASNFILDQGVINAVGNVVSPGDLGMVVPMAVVSDLQNLNNVYGNLNELQDVVQSVVSVGDFVNSLNDQLQDIHEPI